MRPEALVKVVGDAYITLGRDGKALEKIDILHHFALQRYSISWWKKMACHPKLCRDSRAIGADRHSS